MTSSGIHSDGKAGTRKTHGLKPIEPGSVFPRDIPAIYIVFESAPLEDPAQFSAQWFLEGEKGVAFIRSARQRHLGSAGA